MMKKCLNCNKTYKNNRYVCSKCGRELIDVGSQTIKPTKPFKISDERAVGINESAGKVGCWTIAAFFIFLILSIFSGGNVFFIALTIIDVVIIAICIAAQSAVEKHVAVVRERKSAEIKEKEKEKQAERQREINNKKLVAFYDKCIENGIRNLDNDAALQKATLIAGTFGLYDDCTECYNKGKDLRTEIYKKENVERLNKLREEERNQHFELTKYSSYIGREKEIKMLSDLIAPYKNKLAQLQAEADKEQDGFWKGPPQKAENDWAIQGGIASGLAGGAAGVAVALNAQQENEKIREWNDEARKMHVQQHLMISQYLASQRAEINKKLKPLEEKLEKAKIKLVEKSDEQELLDMIAFENTKVKFSDTGAFAVNVSSIVREPIKLYENTNAIIDGDIQVDLFQDGKSVGKAVLVAPINGFGNASLNGICLENNNTVQKDKPYEIKIKPYHLWKIEA